MLSGVTGSQSTQAPERRVRSASSIAEMIAAGAGIVPASPTPR
jgi:hypothetical protein